MVFHKLACRSMSLHAVPWDYMKFHELGFSSFLCLSSSQEFRSAFYNSWCHPGCLYHLLTKFERVEAFSYKNLPVPHTDTRTPPLIYTDVLADCTLGEEWAAWGECVPSSGTCGNGTRLRYKEELLPSRHGGDCVHDPESEICMKDCPVQAKVTYTTGSYLISQIFY